MTADPMLLLMTWFSPSYPVGAFSYSHGVEWAVEQGGVHDRATLESWITACLVHGAGRNDMILLTAAWRAPDTDGLGAVTELAIAYQPSRERALESEAQGAAFAMITAAAWPNAKLDGAALPYCVAAGAAGRAHGIAIEPLLAAWAHGFVANLVSAGVRLIPLGQTDGQRIQAALAPVISAQAKAACDWSLDDLGGCALRADLASMHHETQYVRLFRT
jgi:urease accessory protein